MRICVFPLLVPVDSRRVLLGGGVFFFFFFAASWGGGLAILKMKSRKGSK